MSDQIITAYGSGGYSVFLDAESVTTTAGQGGALRQRIQMSVRDITTGTPTTVDVGDAANQAIRVNLVAGSISVASNPNVTITNWTASQTVTITGTVTATGVTIQQATVTQGTTPWTVSFSQGTQVVSLTTAAPWPVTYSAGTQVVSLSTATPWPVTLTNPTVALATGQIVSVTQATTPWTVTYSAGTQPVTFTTAVVSFSGVQPVTVTAIPGQTLDEQGNPVQRTDQQSLFETMALELRAIRVGLQYLVSEMTVGGGSQLDLHETAKELMDSEEVSH